ncbi:MAG: transposase [Hymenobacteraceae bacterium]|nr:transposase [Hymenobacteraceae bacterium]
MQSLPPAGPVPASRRKYDTAFRAEAVRRVQDGQPAAAVGRSLGLSPSVLARWLAAARRPASALADQELAAENRRLRAALAVDEQECDILKKAMTIFSQPLLR